MTEDQKNFKSTPDLAPPEPDDEINLLDLLLVLVRNKWLIIGSCAVTFILACIYTLTLPNIFTANARLLPPQKESSGLSSMLGNMGGLAAMAGISAGGGSGELYVGMLQSRAIADRIIERFDLMERFEWETRSDAYKNLNDKAQFNVGKTDGILTISVDDEDPRLASDMANAYVEELKALNVRLNLDSAGRERQFLEGRLAVVETDLITAEERLKNFQQENKAIKIDEQVQTIIEAISRLRGQLASREVELGVALSYQTEQNPQVKSLRESIAQLKEQIRRLEESPEGQRVPEDIFISTSEVPELGLQYVRLMRDFKVQETLYELLTRQLEVAKIEEAKNTSRFQVLDEAFPPDRKSKPKRALMVLLATFAVGFLSVLVAFMREFGRNLEGEDRQRWEQIKANLRLRS
ncbi:GumC family protein [Geoalkalibacter subterraneus]|jgi:uncharacterized protein involved in exopolysaccharide biosynthesis|uniref:Lipopolysaccharide biosynthesis protein n=1 Tax=Geoalkalibacter subterraneus TaxID=483547 RepID=A0A0B5FVQ4_9BACT|nr:Wzz/FepE/Etk N-terminal domain-containing protein [Geoalkalibacter subterraneus]AJF07661.1 hypothetical protein GSUB_15435 [Geoalkalibacter subterraneus]